jgi:DNA polymerase-3 subunit epsilon
MPSARPTTPALPQLGSRYYLEHFEEMIRFVEEKYAHTFDGAHQQFLDDFRRLNRDARCLYVRMANRKGGVFRASTLAYDEIESLPQAIEQLCDSRFARAVQDADLEGLLRLHARHELARWIRMSSEIPDLAGISTAKKQQLIQHLLRYASLDILIGLIRLETFVVQDRRNEMDYLLFLYFGRPERNLTAFTLRDLGVTGRSRFRTEFESRFATREEAHVSFHYEKLLCRLETADAAELEELVSRSHSWPEAVDPETERLRSRSLHRLGHGLERAGKSEEALAVYRQSRQFPSTERVARLLLALDRRAEAEAWLRGLIDAPSCDEELLFAEDLLARTFGTRRVGRLTALLRSAETIVLDEAMRNHAEAAAIGHYRRRGLDAFHVENTIWRQLFGLVFWDLLFGADAAVHNEFDRIPRGLDSGAFSQAHATEIHHRLARLDRREETIQRLEETWDRHAGTLNAIVPWYRDVFRLTRLLVRNAPPGSLATVLEPMTRQFRRHRSGFPDLLLVDGDALRFVEVKAEGDQIQRHQLAQIERLSAAGFPVSVVRARWDCDPQQEYVVVDVETTGGNAQTNRVTEIGAVRVRGETILEEWTTLVNPGVRIPRRIVSLTGITDAMVAEAPPFAEIAEAFLEFVGPRVFVGHRVAFDYGFLRAECERAGRELHLPTLCTVASMRRYFPGLPSYSLSGLSTHFEIPLESHHRALDDARATAHLLVLLNRKRAASLPP